MSRRHTEQHNSLARRKTNKRLEWTARHGKWAFLLVGLASLAWFLFRVIPKPSRAAYPCQRAAAPLAAGFVIWLIGLTGAAAAFRKAQTLRRQSRCIAALLCAVVAIAAAGLTLPAIWAGAASEEATAPFTPTDRPNKPIGVARGVHPGRVVWVHDPGATSWDGQTGHWWDDNNTSQEAVDAMMSKAIRALAGKDTDGTAWDAIFRHFNKTRGHGDVGYAKGEKIAVKLNLNSSGGLNWPGNVQNPTPQLVVALLRQLVHQGRVPASAITLYDASRICGSPIKNPCHKQFPGVRIVDRTGTFGRVKARAHPEAVVHHGQKIPGSGTAHLPVCVVEANYLINLALLRGHGLAGVTLGAKNHFGSVWREEDKDTWNAGWSPGYMHRYISVHDYPQFKARKMGTFSPLVDLMGHEHLGGKTLLFMIDGLYGAEDASAAPAKWQSAPFNGHWTSSVFVSQDGVAIESVALDFLRSEPAFNKTIRGNLDNYLHEAALADRPPSGTTYDPEADGQPLDSLGAHEHWNDPTAKQYSRNLGTGSGIELLAIAK